MCTTIPTIDFNVETVEYKNQSFTVQKDTEVTHKEIEGGTNINCYLKENQSELSEKRRLKDLAKKLGTQTIQTAQKPRLRKSRRPR